ncbi:MAG: AtpZ/AtpI family protein [Gemmatimonadota bacterium]|nr:AtpZ/AtpI family protein [Gemmatimonadota bacterium]
MTPKRPVSGELGQAWRYGTLGYTFAFSIILFAGVGYLLDRWLGFQPFLTIAGTLVGAGLAFVWVFMKVTRDEAEWREEHPPKSKQP